MTRPALLFDLGGVLIEWDPRRVYRTVFADDAAMEAFLAEVCCSSWNASIDAGKPFAQAVRERQAEFPQFAEQIGYWQTGWTRMLGGAITGTVALLQELRAQDLDLCALSNWSAETFPIAQDRFEFLTWFRRIIVSGEVGLAKPDPAIFHLALEQCGLQAETTVFVDDTPANVTVACDLGLDGILFRNPAQLRADLVQRGLLSSTPSE